MTIQQTKPTSIHARTMYCPKCAQRLTLIHLPAKEGIREAETMNRKACVNCKLKFDYYRSDTVEGRKALSAMYMKRLRDTRKEQPVTEQEKPEVEKPAPMTNVERQRRFREKARLARAAQFQATIQEEGAIL